MCVLLILTVITAVACSSSPEDQNLTQPFFNLTQNNTDFEQNKNGTGVELIVGTIREAIANSNAGLREIIRNVNSNSWEVNRNLRENTNVLRQILQLLRNKDETSTLSPWWNETYTHDPWRNETYTHDPWRNETYTHDPWGNETYTQDPWRNETYTHDPWGNETYTEAPTNSTARDCAELYRGGERSSGIYVVTLIAPWGSEKRVRVFCDMKTNGGGWTVIQRRGDYGNPRDYFVRNWTEYRDGFGELTEEFWLGNEYIAALSNHVPTELHVDLWDMEGNRAYADYTHFIIHGEETQYRLYTEGFSGTAGDALGSNDTEPFSTFDNENAVSGRKCARNHQGGWWFVSFCGDSNLNGLNLRGPDESQEGIFWRTWKNSYYSLAFTEMKLRPYYF